MTNYCTVSDVKKRLQIVEDNTNSDSEIEDLISEVGAILEKDLHNFVSFPLDPVPDLLKFACADLAASIFRGRRVKPENNGEDFSDYFRLGYESKLEKYKSSLGYNARGKVVASAYSEIDEE